ncbi:helix-turn-helix transcriptional regulator [Pseudomonas abieticivorans]|uniref:helix-turn-helix transcriptional regulator n=1 Tax=Pseudomonas abieticivorans TaxID=2931382 RepID=UPI0020C05DCA|nr:AraC family transcriptional regulator [Pseudomonas sp. PIA16]
MALITEQWLAGTVVESSWVRAQAASFPRHTHDEYVLSANLAGHERIWLDGQTLDVPPGSVTLYNPMAVQGSEFGPLGVEYISLHLDAEAVRRVIVDNHLPGPNRCPEFAQGVLQGEGLYSAIVEFAQVAPGRVAEQEEALLGLLGQLLEPATTAAGEHALAMRQATHYLRAHLGQKVELDEVAAAVGLSKYHFVRCFKKATGLAPLQYLMQLRLIEARQRLRKRQPAVDIADELGFYDQSHFINAFRKVMGVTPQVYAAAHHPYPGGFKQII